MSTKGEFYSVFKGDIIGREIIYLDSTTSTNDVAIEIARKREEAEGTVVIADMQTSGRGRHGRCWISPPGVNLYFTVLLKVPASQQVSIISLITAIAVVLAIRQQTGLNAQIKWPNDILINDKKAGGILVEMVFNRHTTANMLAVGIGVNVNMPPEALKDIRPLATSLKIEAGTSIDRVKLLGKILAELERIYKILLNGNKKTLIKEWLRLNCTIGKKVSVQTSEGIITGLAEDIGDEGELYVRVSSEKIETVRAGDVTILKN
jgi:BirA family biotin operon repressor/biotin-[acetyl-CoA-carboxylase] ligase